MREDLAGEDHAIEAPVLLAFGTSPSRSGNHPPSRSPCSQPRSSTGSESHNSSCARVERRRSSSRSPHFPAPRCSTGPHYFSGSAVLSGSRRSHDRSPIRPRGALFFAMILACAGLACGLAYGAALVPFAQWAPDVHQGARTSVTLLLSIVQKIAEGRRICGHERGGALYPRRARTLFRGELARGSRGRRLERAGARHGAHLRVALAYALATLRRFCSKDRTPTATFTGGQEWLGIAIAANTILALGNYVRPIARI